VYAQVSEAAKAVYAVLYSEEQGNEGVHISKVAERAGLCVEECKNGAEELAEAGLVYGTVTPDDYCVMEYVDEE
jgi:hypothetical protein